MHTKMRPKEDKIIKLFFQNPKHWHFDELLKKSGLSRSRLSFWLTTLQKQGLIKRIKPKKHLPYYVSNNHSILFQQKKKLFAITELIESGLIEHLNKIKEVKAAVCFGSFSRSDWYEESDIDIFIYGNDKELNQAKYEVKLQRDIQVHTVRDKTGLKRIEKMLPYIITGNFLKGSINDLEVDVNAKI